MSTKKVGIKIRVVRDNDFADLSFEIDWIEIDNAETIAEDIKGAILNIE